MWMLLKAIVWKWAKTSLRYEEIIGWNPLHQGFPNRGAGTPTRAASLGDARTWIYIHIYLMCMHVCVIYVYSGHWLGCRRGVLGQKSLGTVLFYTCFCSFCCRKKKKHKTPGTDAIFTWEQLSEIPKWASASTMPSHILRSHMPWIQYKPETGMTLSVSHCTCLHLLVSTSGDMS